MIQWLVVLQILVIIGSWESSAITNKRPSSTEQSGSVRYFRHISNGPSSGPLADWEVGLREAIHQALLREGYWEPNLRQRLNSAQLIGRQDITSTFGDVVVLARGQIYAIHGGNFILLQDPYQNDCDDCHNPRRCERHDCQPYAPHNQEILVALWTVKRLRHRDVDRTRFELEYIINPVNAENDQIIMRRNRFNYAIPGHVFVIRSSETNKHYPEYYNRKIVQTHFKPEVILGVDSEGHKHVLYSYPGFITSPPQISTNEITTSIPSLSTTEMNANFTKETDVYKKLLEALASKTSTTQKTEEGPHRFSLNRFADANKVMPTNRSITIPLIPETTTIQPPIPSSTKATVHYFMPTGEEVLMEATEAPKTTTEKVTPKTTTEKSTIKPTKKYYSTKTSFKPNTKKFTTAATTTSRKTTKTTTLISTTTSAPTTISTTELLTPLTTLPATPRMKFSTKSKYTPKIPSTSSLPKTTSFYPVYKRPKPFSPTKPTLVTTGLTTERVTTPKILTTEKVTTSTMLTTEKVTTNIVTTEETIPTKVPTTVTISSVITEPPATTVSTTQQSSTKIPIETSSTVSSTNKYSTIPTTFTVPLKTTTPEMYTNTEPTEEPSNISGSSAVPPTEPMQAVTEIPIVNEETETPMSVQETQGTTLMPQEIISTTLIYSTNLPNTTFEATTQTSSSLFTTLSQIPSTPTKLPSKKSSGTTTQRTTTVSDFLTAADPYKGPLYTGTVKNDYDADDIFGATKSTTKPSTTTTESHTESDISHQLFDRKSPRNTKIIFSNFYKASTEGNLDTTISDDRSNDDSFLTSQSYETSVSYEVNKRNQPDLTTSAVVKLNNTKKAKVKGVEYKRNHSKLLHYKPSKVTTDTFTKANVKQMPSNGTDYVIYKAEYPNEANETNHTQSSIEVNEASQMKTTKEAFDDVALMLINHAKSLEYLSKTENKTVRVKYRRRKIYVPRSRSTRKPARKGQNQESK